MRKQTFFLLIIMILSGLSVSAQNYKGKQKDIDKILSNIKQFSQFYMNGDAESIANCYTQDGKIFPSNMDIESGKSALTKYWTMSEGVKVKYHKITPVEIIIQKKTAYDYGYYEGETILKDGTSSKWRGKYVIIWKKVNKDWKIYLDIWNSIKD